ncbi:MAG TPA: hypothetical protein PKK06_08565 [Phycisphaerae bacterium]|nr:hypothetical protein [Phycisphaerae bacterium]HNU45238.1 hypothetical protein [Phycisphaerae bacterium]
MTHTQTGRRLAKVLAGALLATLAETTCSPTDFQRLVAGVNAVVNYDEHREITFDDWLDQELDKLF